MANRARWIITPIAAGAAVLAGSRPGLARITFNTIDPAASLSARGRVAEGVVLVACTEGERVKLRLTLTQGAAIGEGRTKGECTGESEGDLTRYPMRVVARGAADFQPGRADACAVAVNTDRGKAVDTRQWCRADGIELVEK